MLAQISLQLIQLLLHDTTTHDSNACQSLYAVTEMGHTAQKNVLTHTAACHSKPTLGQAMPHGDQMPQT